MGGNDGIHTGQADDLGGKIVPGADPFASAVIQAVFVGHAQVQDLVGQVHCIGGVAQLIVDNFQLAELFAGVDDGLDEVFAVVAVQPRSAHDEVTVAELPDIVFAHELGGAISADRAGLGGFVLRDAAVLFAGEYIVGGNMDQPCAGFFCSLCQIAGADGVGFESGVVVSFAAIYIGVGSAVDDNIRAVAADKFVHHFIVGNVQLRQIHRDNGGVEQLFGDGAKLAAALPQLLEDLGAELTLAACDNDLHKSASLLLSISACHRPHSSSAGHRGFCRSAQRFPAAYRGRSSRI